VSHRPIAYTVAVADEPEQTFKHRGRALGYGRTRHRAGHRVRVWVTADPDRTNILIYRRDFTPFVEGPQQITPSPAR
jgi:hypothetical protein